MTILLPNLAIVGGIFLLPAIIFWTRVDFVATLLNGEAMPDDSRDGSRRMIRELSGSMSLVAPSVYIVDAPEMSGLALRGLRTCIVLSPNLMLTEDKLAQRGTIALLAAMLRHPHLGALSLISFFDTWWNPVSLFRSDRCQ